MMKVGRWLNFGAVMKLGLFFCLLMVAIKGFSQDKTVAGIVYNKNSKDRVAAVDIHNITTGISEYNTLKGEFKIAAKAGDRLVFSKDDYHPDTVIIQNNDALAIYMAPLAIQLMEVTVHDSVLSPEARLAATKRDYTKVYGSLAYGDFLTSPAEGGAGLSIDALWNSLSRSGRDAKKLRETIDNDYKQNVIDFRFNRTFVGKITQLKDQRLTDFMLRYRPGYYTTQTATDYEFIIMIRANLRRYLRNPRTYTLPALVSK